MATAEGHSFELAARVQFDSKRLERVFAHCFATRWRTLLRGGADEPVYRPADNESDYHLLYYRSDYFASALHEVAHWCIAGCRRRRLPDFGYWYAPDGRDPQQQRAFEAVEYKPQALEWWFSRGCGYRFRVSVDNLDITGHSCPDTAPFKQRILVQARHWQSAGLPARAEYFFAGLCREFGTDPAPARRGFCLSGMN